MWGEHKDTQYYVQDAFYMGIFLITFWSMENPHLHLQKLKLANIFLDSLLL
jgi:hypothetical protein